MNRKAQTRVMMTIQSVHFVSFFFMRYFIRKCRALTWKLNAFCYHLSSASRAGTMQNVSISVLNNSSSDDAARDNVYFPFARIVTHRKVIFCRSLRSYENEKKMQKCMKMNKKTMKCDQQINKQQKKRNETTHRSNQMAYCRLYLFHICHSQINSKQMKIGKNWIEKSQTEMQTNNLIAAPRWYDFQCTFSIATRIVHAFAYGRCANWKKTANGFINHFYGIFIDNQTILRKQSKLSDFLLCSKVETFLDGGKKTSRTMWKNDWKQWLRFRHAIQCHFRMFQKW